MSWGVEWNPFFVYVVDPVTGSIIVSRDYDKANQALEGIMKAYNYYLGKGQDVNIDFKNWENTLIMRFRPMDKEYEFLTKTAEP